MAARAPIVSVKVEGLDKSIKKLNHYQAPALVASVRKAQRAAAQSLVAPMRAAAPRSPAGQTGKKPHKSGALAASIRARSSRKRPGEVGAMVVGPKIWYRHFPIKGAYGGERKAPESRFVTAAANSMRGQMKTIFDTVLHRELQKP